MYPSGLPFANFKGLYNVLESTPPPLGPYAVTVGCFDDLFAVGLVDTFGSYVLFISGITTVSCWPFLLVCNVQWFIGGAQYGGIVIITAQLSYPWLGGGAGGGAFAVEMPPVSWDGGGAAGGAWPKVVYVNFSGGAAAGGAWIAPLGPGQWVGGGAAGGAWIAPLGPGQWVGGGAAGGAFGLV
jgi:hypothetical protein